MLILIITLCATIYTVLIWFIFSVYFETKTRREIQKLLETEKKNE